MGDFYGLTKLGLFFRSGPAAGWELLFLLFLGLPWETLS